MRRGAAEVVTAKCVSCAHRKSFGPGEVPAGEEPMCPKCYSPMVVVGATVRQMKRKA